MADAVPVLPYHQPALYPLIELLERVALRFEREEAPPQRLHNSKGSWYSMACRWRRRCPSWRPSSPSPLTPPMPP